MEEVAINTSALRHRADMRRRASPKGQRQPPLPKGSHFSPLVGTLDLDTVRSLLRPPRRTAAAAVELVQGAGVTEADAAAGSALLEVLESRLEAAAAALAGTASSTAGAAPTLTPAPSMVADASNIYTEGVTQAASVAAFYNSNDADACTSSEWLNALWAAQQLHAPTCLLAAPAQPGPTVTFATVLAELVPSPLVPARARFVINM